MRAWSSVILPKTCGFWKGRRGVVDGDGVSRWLAHNSTRPNADLLNFRDRNENG